MIYLALAVAICVAVWEAIQLVKTRRQLAAEREALKRTRARLIAAQDEAQPFSTHYDAETLETFRLIATAMKNGASVKRLDDESIGGTD